MPLFYNVIWFLVVPSHSQSLRGNYTVGREGNPRINIEIQF